MKVKKRLTFCFDLFMYKTKPHTSIQWAGIDIETPGNAIHRELSVGEVDGEETDDLRSKCSIAMTLT